MNWRFWPALALALFAGTAAAIPLDTLGTFCGMFPAACRGGTESLLAARGTGTNAYYVLEVDPATGALPVDVVGGSFSVTVASDGPTGSPVPAEASYTGLNNGGNLIGAVGDSSGRQIVVGPGTAGTASGGVLTVQGISTGGAVPVTQSSTPWAVIGSGLAGTPATGVLTVQGITSMTPLKVDGSGVTGPVNVTQFGGNNVVTGTGTGGNGIPRVTVSSDSSLSATNFPTTADVNAGLTGSSTIRTVQAGYASTTTIVASNDYSSTNVGTGAYVQLIASTANATNTVCVSSANAAPIKIATGAAASEVDRIYLPGGGAGCYLINIPASTRISLRSLSGTASTGFFLYTGY